MRSSITPKKPRRGCGIVAWSRGSGCVAGPSEMGDVNAGRKRIDVGVPIAFCFVKVATTGEDQVGPLEQLCLPTA